MIEIKLTAFALRTEELLVFFCGAIMTCADPLVFMWKPQHRTGDSPEDEETKITSASAIVIPNIEELIGSKPSPEDRLQEPKGPDSTRSYEYANIQMGSSSREMLSSQMYSKLVELEDLLIPETTFPKEPVRVKHRGKESLLGSSQVGSQKREQEQSVQLSQRISVLALPSKKAKRDKETSHSPGTNNVTENSPSFTSEAGTEAQESVSSKTEDSQTSAAEGSYDTFSSTVPSGDESNLPVFEKMFLVESPKWTRMSTTSPKKTQKSPTGPLRKVAPVSRPRPILPRESPPDVPDISWTISVHSSQLSDKSLEETQTLSEDLKGIPEYDLVPGDSLLTSTLDTTDIADTPEVPEIELSSSSEETSVSLDATSDEVVKVFSHDDDEEIIQAAAESEKSQSLMPLIKEELKTRIRLRRLLSGEGEVEVEFKQPEYKLTMEELQRRERKREQNRQAALRSRERQSKAEDTIQNRYMVLEKEHKKLTEEKRALLAQKEELRRALEPHIVAQCDWETRQEDIRTFNQLCKRDYAQ